MSLESLDPRSVQLNPPHLDHFYASLKVCHSSVAEADLEQYAQWERQFGQNVPL